MQAVHRLFDQVNANRTARLTGLCFILIVGLLFTSGIVSGPTTIAGQRSSQQQDLVLENRKAYCLGPETEPNTRREPWWKKFAQQLADEVASKDAEQVGRQHKLPYAWLLIFPPFFTAVLH